jgi:hypothetical protein
MPAPKAFVNPVPTPANPLGLWTLADLTTKVQNDLELHGENFVEPIDIGSFVNDAIDDAEQIIVDLFSDFFLTFKDIEVKAGQSLIPLPIDLYEARIRGFYYSESGFNSLQPSGRCYKVKKLPLELLSNIQAGDDYQYRLINRTNVGMLLHMFPPIAEDSVNRFRLWYIRKAKRVINPSDYLENGIRPQFVLAHTKCSAMKKEGDPALEIEKQNLTAQMESLKSTLSRLSDDDEDSYLYPDQHSLDESYGGGESW